MALARKPKREGPTEADVQAVIGKGGLPAGGARGVRKVLLRMPADMLVRVDAVAGARAVPTTRTTWLLEAVAEKLAAEEGG